MGNKISEKKYNKFVDSFDVDFGEFGIIELRFGHKALKKAERLLKRPMTQLITENLSTEEIEKLLMCAMSHKKDMKLCEIETMLDCFPTMYAVEPLTKAFESAIGVEEKEEDEEIKESIENEEEKN